MASKLLLTIFSQLLRKINPSDEVLNSTKIALRVMEWCRKDEGEYRSS